MIRGERIDLRPVTEADLDHLEDWMSDPDFHGEFNTFALNRPGEIRRAFATHGFLAEERGRLLIVTKAGELAGDVTYRQVNHGPGVSNRVFEIGITIAPAHRGQGHGAAAQRLLVAYLFSTSLSERVQATTDVTNVAEQRSLERAGFTREGILRRAQFRAGTWHDMVMYSKLRGEP